MIIHIKVLVLDTLEFTAREYPEQIPAYLKRFLYGTRCLIPLRHILFFKPCRKLGIELIRIRKRSFTEYDGKLFSFLSACICRKQLVHNAGVIGSRFTFAYTLVLEPRKRGQNVDGGRDTLQVEFT